MTIKRLIGSAPSQISRNKDLGTMAFQDAGQYYGLNSSPSFRNRIINGAMMIDQRNTGASVTNPNGSFITDRFKLWNYIGTTTSQQSSTAPSGFKNSLLVTTGTASAPSVSYTYQLGQNIEGYNIADMGFGASGAATFTLSFWVRSSVTGTFAVAFQNADNSRSYVATYTISSANTFEYKTVTVTGDTTGTWLTTNGSGLQVWFDLGSGSNYNTATPNTWQASLAYRTSGTVTLGNTTGSTFYITGVQLEKGTAATPFEFRPYGTELALCQRYYVRWDNKSASGATALGPATSYNGSTVFCNISFPVVMRAVPTYVYSAISDFSIYGNSTGGHPSNVSQGIEVSTFSGEIQLAYTTLSGGQGCFVRIDTGAAKYFACNAEL